MTATRALARAELLDQAREAWTQGQRRTKAETADLIIEFQKANPEVGYREIAERCRIINDDTNRPYSDGWYKVLVRERTSGKDLASPGEGPWSGLGDRRNLNGARKTLREHPEEVVREIAEAMTRPEVRHAVEDTLRRSPRLQAETVVRSMPEPPARSFTQEQRDAARAEHLPDPLPPSPWQPFFQAMLLLGQVHERMHEDAWNLPPGQIENIAANAEREAAFLSGLADAAAEHIHNQ